MKRILFVALSALLATGAFAQTVTVDGVGGGDPNYATLAEAITAFASGEIHDGNAAPNIINITVFGPFEEVIPVFGSGTFSEANPVLASPEESLVIQGSGVTPLILAADTGFSGSSWIVNGGFDLTLNNLVTAQAASAGNDDFFFVINNDTQLTTTDVVVTALPASANTYTGIGDIAAGLLDGTAAYDATLIRSGDNGAFVGVTGQTTPCTWDATNTVLTQQGAGGSPDGFVMYVQGVLNLNEGCVVSNNNRMGIQCASGLGATVNAVGARTNRVVFYQNGLENGAGFANAITNWGSLGITISEVSFVGNQQSGYYDDAAVTNTIDIDDALFVDGVVDGIDLAGDDDPLHIGWSNITVANCGTDGIWINNGGVELTDTIIAGPGTNGINFSTAANVATLENCAIHAGGPVGVVTAIAGSGTVAATPAVIGDNPDFANTTFTLAGAQDITGGDYFDVRNLVFATAGSGGSALGGGADYVGGGLPVELSVIGTD